MMERGDKLLEISGALEYMQNHRIDDVTTLIENVTLTNKKGKAVKRCTYTLYMTEARNLNRIYCNEHIKGKAVMSIDIDQTGIKSTFERAIKEGIDYVEILFHSEEPFMTSRKFKKFANGYGRKHSRPNISATQQPTVRSYMELLRTGLLMNKEKEKGIKTDNIDLSSPCYLSDTRCKGWILEPVCPTYSSGNLLRTEIYTNVIPIRV